MEGNILDAARFVGAGLSMIGAAGAGVGICDASTSRSEVPSMYSSTRKNEPSSV